MFGLEWKRPKIVVVAPGVDEMITGKFCNPFGPASASRASLSVKPLLPRSMPRSPLEWMELA